MMMNAQHKSADSLFSSPTHRKPDGGGGCSSASSGCVAPPASDPFSPLGEGSSGDAGAHPSTPGFSSAAASCEVNGAVHEAGDGGNYQGRFGTSGAGAPLVFRDQVNALGMQECRKISDVIVNLNVFSIKEIFP